MDERTGSQRHGADRLRVYHLALELGQSLDRIIRRVRISRSLADQLERAADSVVLNIAEGAGHYSPGRKAFHYQTARGSAGECIAVLTRVRRRHPGPDVDAARRTANMICVMLTALIHTQENRKR